ncbi:putative integral membrane protein [Theileria parva strain Muguga]|uniref:Uncharacterized protein n=1 Tax=Theileria parva TaxID=5875 RepID=Q4N6M6_THEPA|nr:putative integral membrane protein [Theileria parva strain Muguga]EAN34382.1 putative integral membrane protein [Theileria parva strain Muguga]|eukprot:XP_766665.1 hypothetical protein [Theileria parva strain Muguga]
MKLIPVLIFVSIKLAFSTNSILFGPGYPSRFACVSDAYSLESSLYKLPKEFVDKYNKVALDVSRVVELPEEVGIDRELVESGLTLFDESKVLRNGLVYTSIEYSLQRHIARDYVSSQMVLASLNGLKTISYISNVLRAFARSNITKYNTKLTDEAKYGLCSAFVYGDVADALDDYRTKQLQKIRAENKRITHNISQLGRVKSTGNMWLLTGSAMVNCINTLFVIMSMIAISMI